MKTLELISTLLLVSGCGIQKSNPFADLKELNLHVEKVPAKGIDPNMQKDLNLPKHLSEEEIESNDGTYTTYQGVKIQVEPPRLAYPSIDTASAECRRLTEDELQEKRDNPEKSISCVNL